MPATTSAQPDVAAARQASWTEPEGKPFLHSNHWFVRQGHSLLLWNATSSTWDDAGAAARGVLPGDSVGSTRFTSLRTPAIWLYVLLGFFGAMTAVAVVADGVQFAAFDRRANGEFVSLATRDNALGFFYAMKVLQYLGYVVTAGIFIWWTRRATCNVAALGAANPSFTPGWSIGWWFIPIANWFQPLRVLNQAWRASDPSLPAGTNDGWRRVSLTPLLPIWWISYMVVSGVWGAIWGQIDEASMTDRSLADATAAVLVFDILMLAVTGLAIWVVVGLTRRQDRAAELRLGLGQADPKAA